MSPPVNPTRIVAVAKDIALPATLPSRRRIPYDARMSALHPFHLAIPVHDLGAARAFYGTVFGCPEGRSDTHWVDFNLFGHQLVAHLDASAQAHVQTSNPVDGHQVPVPHFGVVLEWQEWHRLVERLRAAGLRFVIEPHIRFPGLIGEQATFFLYDPSGNALEFKAFQNPQQLFAH